MQSLSIPISELPTKYCRQRLLFCNDSCWSGNLSQSAEQHCRK